MFNAIESQFRRGARCARFGLGIVVTLSTVLACAPSPDHSSHTVAYYREHAQELQAKLAECSNDPGGVGRTVDCVNAREAGRIESIGTVRDLPPMGLTQASQKDASGSTSRQ